MGSAATVGGDPRPRNEPVGFGADRSVFHVDESTIVRAALRVRSGRPPVDARPFASGALIDGDATGCVRVTELAPSLVGGALLLLSSVVVAFSLRHAVRGVRLVAADSLSSASATGDFVRLSGLVVTTNERLRGPFTGTDCVAVQFGVEERGVGSYCLPSWERIGGGRARTGFEVRGDGRQVAVGDDPSTVSLAPSSSVTVERGEEPPESVREYLRTTDEVTATGATSSTLLRRVADRCSVTPPKPLSGRFSFGDRRYLERRLDPGDRVTVFGRVADGTRPDRHLDPLVVSDASPVGTAFRVARRSTTGLAVGAIAGAVGLAVLLV